MKSIVKIKFGIEDAYKLRGISTRRDAGWGSFSCLMQYKNIFHWLLYNNNYIILINMRFLYISYIIKILLLICIL
jgi:hypothetical protein